MFSPYARLFHPAKWSKKKPLGALIQTVPDFILSDAFIAFSSSLVKMAPRPYFVKFDNLMASSIDRTFELGSQD